MRTAWLLLRTKPGAFTALFLVALASYEVWLSVGGQMKMVAAGLPSGKEAQNVEVVLSIEPEQFHLLRLQEAGRLVRFEKRSAFILDVPPESLAGLARNPWVESIRPWSGE
jgi:hypothetical protein